VSVRMRLPLGEELQVSRADQIAQLSKASDWRAALMILTSDYFDHNDARVWGNVDLQHGCIHFDRMLHEGTFSSGERTLLQIAASLFSTKIEVNLWRAFGRLDENACRLALKAMASFCGVEAL